MTESYVVAGGSGFISSHVVDELLASGHPAKAVLHSFSMGCHGSRVVVAEGIRTAEARRRVRSLLPSMVRHR